MDCRSLVIAIPAMLVGAVILVAGASWGIDEPVIAALGVSSILGGVTEVLDEVCRSYSRTGGRVRFKRILSGCLMCVLGGSWLGSPGIVKGVFLAGALALLLCIVAEVPRGAHTDSTKPWE